MRILVSWIFLNLWELFDDGLKLYAYYNAASPLLQFITKYNDWCDKYREPWVEVTFVVNYSLL